MGIINKKKLSRNRYLKSFSIFLVHAFLNKGKAFKKGQFLAYMVRVETKNPANSFGLSNFPSHRLKSGRAVK